jgi:hypothetical protein
VNETQHPRRTIWLAIVAGAIAAIGGGAALVIALRSGSPSRPPPPTPWTLTAPVLVPAPPADLLAAQSAALAGDATALAALEQTMRGYRSGLRGLPAEVAAKHASADRFMDAGQAYEAARAVASIVESAPAVTGALADSRRILIQDAYFRLCRLALSAGQAIVTSVQTHQALALGEPDNDPFVVNLLLVRAAASDRTGEAAQATADRARVQALLSRSTGNTKLPVTGDVNRPAPGRPPGRRTTARARSR